MQCTEQQIVLLCFSGAIVLGICAAFLPSKRRRVIIPAAALSLLAAYEFGMDQWEKTVTAPIRLDLFLEIPLIVVSLIWGVLALIFSGQRKNTTTHGRS